MKVEANGIAINCQIEGPDGAPWLVFSNSLATDLTMWDDQAAVLKNGFRVLRYDQRGHGKTDAPPGKYDFATLIADLVALYDALSIKAAHFVGISMGGATGQGLAQAHPARVDKLVLCDCPAASTPATAQAWAERIELAKSAGMDALVEITLGRWFPPEFVATKAPVLDKVRNMIRATPVNGFIGGALALSDFDFKPGLGAIAAPTLLIGGTKDAAFPGVKFLNGAIPGSKLVALEGAGHLSNLEQPGPFTQAVEDFLEN